MAKQIRKLVDVKDLEGDLEKFREKYNIPKTVWDQMNTKQRIQAVIAQMLEE
jgi:hypothetical protein